MLAGDSDGASGSLVHCRWEHSVAVSYEVKPNLAVQRSNPLLDVYPNEIKEDLQGTSMQMFISALLIIAPQKVTSG